MRLHRLDLIRYGRFTDRSVGFPAAPKDFHLIVGPNEAGKSTLRSAILDLLFGIPMRSTLGFFHPINELRLGALIGAEGRSLEFHRAKSRKETLRSPKDGPLDDSVLVPYLGSANRDFFDRMFGLDHTRLVEGGNSILNAENDVGQILFQSAAGVAVLGKIRDALLAEADALWAPRKSGDREYYQAAAQLEAATDALKLATVRTRSWTEANNKVEELQESITTQTSRLHDLQVRRTQLERVRRLAPSLLQLRENQKQLAEIGEVIDLPADGADTLAHAEDALSTAKAVFELRENELESIQTELQNVTVDASLLATANAITLIEQRRVQYGAYARDIENRKVEIDSLWQDVRVACNQLGWACESQEIVTARLPTLFVRRALMRLARDHGGIRQSVNAAAEAERGRRKEIEELSALLGQIQLTGVSAVLRAALASARSLGDVEIATQKHESAVLRTKAAVDEALQSMGRRSRPVTTLRAMEIPGQQTLGRWVRERDTLESDQRAALQRLGEARNGIGHLELEISHLKAEHDPVTRESVLEARRERDGLWSTIKQGEVPLEQGIAPFESSMQRADEIGDARLNDVEAAASLQNLQHQLELAHQRLVSVEGEHNALDVDLQLFNNRWIEDMSTLDLGGLSLDDFDEWLAKRATVIAADDACRQTLQSSDEAARSVATAKRDLADALLASGIQVPETFGLRAHCTKAEDHIKAADEASVRFETLSRQQATARAQVSMLRETTESANAQHAEWTDAWSKALIKASLAVGSEIGIVEDALELIGTIDDKLGKMHQIQIERIDAMNYDLERFAADAQTLTNEVAPDLDGRLAAEIAQALTSRLASNQEASVKVEELKTRARTASKQAEDARIAIGMARASLKPFMEQAGVDSNEALREAITRSDVRRRVAEQISMTRNQLIHGSDGLDLAQIELEVESADLAQLTAELERVKHELDEVQKKQNVLSGEFATAARVLSDIGGSDAAARAEAQRQEALARMSDVAERYVKVFTAARLLRWSVDRYRQEKQGPLLAQASTIFSKLTLGSFNRLIVDFDQEPMVLEGKRGDGTLVGVSGMSDGTRDQLYLALRLAALEMHLDHAAPLPFIADDLFINYDDARARAGLEALGKLSERTQVIFLSHHDHLIPSVRAVFGDQVSVVTL